MITPNHNIKFDIFLFIIYTIKETMNYFTKYFILFIIVKTTSSAGITITHSPDKETKLGSSQIISWSTSVDLDSVKLDLYYHNQFKTTLGETSQSLTNYKWVVPNNLALGDNYFIKVTGKSIINGTAWANTDSFSISSSMNQKNLVVYIIIGIIIVIVCISSCRTRNRYTNNSYPVAGTVGGNVLPVTYAQSSGGYSGSSVAVAGGGGFLAGMATERLLEGGGNNSGGGGFFGGDSGGGGGGFFGDDSGGGGGGFFGGDSGGGGGDNSGGFF